MTYRALTEYGWRRSARRAQWRLSAGFLLALGCLLASGNIMALGLGQMTVHSRLGANLQAEVELLAAAGEDRYAPECFRLAPAVDTSTGLPVLTRASLTVERNGERFSLLVRSMQPVNEPVLLVSLRAGCGAEVIREYTLLIDGPAPEPVRSVREDRVEKRVVPSEQVADTPTLKKPVARRPLPPGRTSQTKRETPAAREHKPARQPKKAVNEPDLLPAGRNTGGMSDRLSLSGASPDDDWEADQWSLRLSTELSYERVNTATESQRAILRLEYKLLAAIYEQANQQLNLAEQVRQLEASVADLRAVTEKSLNMPVGAGLAQNPEATGRTTPAVVPPSLESAAAVPVAETQDGSLSNWLWMASALAIVILLVGLLRRSSHRPARDLLTVPPESDSDDETLLLSAPGHVPTQPKTAIRPVAIPAGAAPTPAERDVTRDLQPITFAPPGQQSATVVIEHDEFDPVMELAEIMLAFGRVKGAIEALQEYVDNHPDGAIQPWMKLIEIYRQNGMRAEYEAFVPSFQAHFNVSPAEWAALPDVASQPAQQGDEENCAVAVLLARTPNIAAQTALRDAIVLQWGAGPQDTLVYLNALLRDKNNPTHQGCSLSMVNELLYLLTVLEQRLGRAG